MPRGVVVALALVLALNYVDRSSLATAAPLVQAEFGLTSSQLGLGVLVRGVATALHGLASGFAMMFCVRLVLALGECVTFPSIQMIVNQNSGLGERGRVSSLISSGQGFGPMIGTLFGGLAMAAFGWRLSITAQGRSRTNRSCSGGNFGGWHWGCLR